MIGNSLQTVTRWLTIVRGQAYYDRLYLAMHKSQAFHGDTWRAHLHQLRQVVPDLEQLTILDFGCGPKGGLSREYRNVIPYDPYVTQFSAPPWEKQFDVVFSSDVLEHMTRRQISEFLSRLRRAAPKFIFLVASTRKAQKSLPNGANAHLTVQPPGWWLAFVANALGSHYLPIMATADLIREDVSLCFKLADSARAGV